MYLNFTICYHGWPSPSIKDSYQMVTLRRSCETENTAEMFFYWNVLSFSQYINILMTYPLSYLQSEIWYSPISYLTESKFQITSCKLTSICSVLLTASCLLARLSNTQTLKNRGIYSHTWTSLKGHNSSSMWPALSLHSKWKSCKALKQVPKRG